MNREKIIDGLEPGISLLIEGNVESKSALFSYFILTGEIERKIALISFNTKSHTRYLFEKYGRENIIPFEAEEDLTKLGILHSKAVSSGAKIFYSDVFSILTSKTDFDRALDSLRKNIETVRKSGGIYILNIDPSSFDEKELSILESVLDIVVTLENRDGKFYFRYKKHESIDASKEYEFSPEDENFNDRNEAEIYRDFVKVELENILLYIKNLEKFGKDDTSRVKALVDGSMSHASKFLELLFKKTDFGEKTNFLELEDILREGLKEERMLKERYANFANYEGGENLMPISKEEETHEKIVEKILEEKQPA